MFAQTVKFNIFHDDHIIGFSLKKGAVDHRGKILRIAPGQELPTAFHPFRGFDKAFTFRVFTDFNENLFLSELIRPVATT